MPRGSWYSQLPPFGWFDPQDRPGSSALGVPDSQQGIALPSRAGLGKWFNVTPPGGGLPYPMQQTDIGPAKWTGRGVDISAAGAHQMGYTPKNFPTDANFKVEPRDEPRGLGSPAGMPVQAGEIPDNTDETQTPYAGGPPPQQGRKMPNSLMDMFQPQDAAGQPVGFGDAVTGRSNSLIGLGLGLLSPSNPLRGESSWSNALQGYMGGAGLDARQATAKASLAQHATDRKQAQANFERTFAENKMTEAEKLARASGLQPGTPEHQAFVSKAIQSKAEGDLSVVEVQHPLYPDQKVPKLFNRRTGAFTDIPATGGMPGTTAVGAGPDAPLAGGGVAPANPGTPGATGPTGAAATAPGRAFPPPQPGMSSKIYTEEMTKRAVKEQAEQERNKKQAGMIDPVKEDIAQAIKIIEANPGSTTGLYGSMASKFGGQAGDLSGLLTTIKARISFDELQKMRAASPTGGALGNVSDKDMAALQAVEGSIEQSRTPGQLLFNLERLDRMRHEVIHGPGTAPPAKYAPPDPSGVSARKTGGAAAPRPGFVKGGYVFKGGDPSDQANWAPVK